MIVLVTGPPGSGKTYYALRKMVEALETGKTVASNVELVDGWAERIAAGNPFRRLIPGGRRRAADRYRSRVHVTPDLEELARIRLKGEGESRGVLVLDEAHGWLNARNWNEGDRLDVIGFFSQHRKLGWDVYLITQDAQNVDRQVRSLFEYQVTLRNVKRMKVAGIPVLPFNFFLAIWKWHAASGAIIKRETYRLNWTARLYSTYATHESAKVPLIPRDVIWLPRDPSEPNDTVLTVQPCPLDEESDPMAPDRFPDNDRERTSGDANSWAS